MSFIFLSYIHLSRRSAAGRRLHLLVKLLLFPLLSDLKRLAKDGHEVKAIALQVDPLSLQVVIDELLLLTNYLAASANLLQQDLHHIHLADGQTLHLVHGLLRLKLVLGRLQIAQLAHYCAC